MRVTFLVIVEKIIFCTTIRYEAKKQSAYTALLNTLDLLQY
jgi:hypothetical protein